MRFPRPLREHHVRRLLVGDGTRTVPVERVKDHVRRSSEFGLIQHLPPIRASTRPGLDGSAVNRE